MNSLTVCELIEALERMPHRNAPVVFMVDGVELRIVGVSLDPEPDRGNTVAAEVAPQTKL